MDGRLQLSPRTDRPTAGFTLIELMIVVVVLGILAAIAIPRFYTFGEDAKGAEAKAILKQLYVLQERHKIASGGYADRFEELEGSAAPAGSATYSEFRMQKTAAGFLACSIPKAGEQKMKSFQIDHDATLVELGDPSQCTGNAP